ncbi:MAG: GatB/YqeY domain-containing protein [Eubacteriales bacterium]
MSLKDRLANDFKDALKEKDAIKKNTVNLVRAAIKQFEVDKRVEIDEQGIFEILAKQVKMRKDALADFEKAGRTDLLEDYNKEIAILSEYLPTQLTRSELVDIIEAAASELGIDKNRSNMGKLMGAVIPKVKGKADGNLIKEIVESILS